MKKLLLFVGIIVVLIIAYIAISWFNTPKLHGVTPAQAKQLYNPRGNIIQGNSHGNITMVEFFGYKCHYCRKDFPIIQKFLKTHSNVRVVYKEYLLFGDESKLPCYAALAAAKQGKCLAMHNAMLTANKPLTLAEIKAIAKKQHLNITVFLHDLKSPGIRSQIAANTALSKALKIGGAPTVIFVNSSILKHPKQVSEYKQYIQTGHLTDKALDKLAKKAGE